MTNATSATAGIGYTGKCVHHLDVPIYERIVHYAYARNGNAHNPTPYKAWDIFRFGSPGNGAPHMSCRTLREAKKIIRDGLEE